MALNSWVQEIREKIYAKRVELERALVGEFPSRSPLVIPLLTLLHNYTRYVSLPLVMFVTTTKITTIV